MDGYLKEIERLKQKKKDVEGQLSLEISEFSDGIRRP